MYYLYYRQGLFHFTDINKWSSEGQIRIFYAEKPMLAQRKKQAFPPNFLVRRFSVNGFSENLRKLSVYGKFPHQEIRCEEDY